MAVVKAARRRPREAPSWLEPHEVEDGRRPGVAPQHLPGQGGLADLARAEEVHDRVDPEEVTQARDVARAGEMHASNSRLSVSVFQG